MTSPFDFFDKIYCINLPKNPERWKVVSKQFEKLGIGDRVEKMWADPPDEKIYTPRLKYPRGEIGVSLSQTKAIVHALASNANNVLMFEDDIEFESDSCNRLKLGLEELPADWEIFFLGGNPIKPMSKVANSTHLLNTNHFLCAQAYALNKSVMLPLYNRVIDNISKDPFDLFTSLLAGKGRGFALNPPICWQTPGDSVIRNAHRDYKRGTQQNWDKYTP